MTQEDRDNDRRAVAAANAGREMPVELLPAVPARTLHCNGMEFKSYRLLARTLKQRTMLYLPVASPLSPAILCWAVFSNFVDMTYTAFLVAVSVGFNHARSLQETNWLGLTDWVGSAVYLMDMAVGFHTGFVASWAGHAVVVRDARTCAWYYIRHGTFVVDAIASIPIVLQVIFLAANYTGHMLRLFYALRLLRLLRVMRLLRELAPGSSGGPMRPFISMLSPQVLIVIAATYSMLVLVNLLGCLWWNMALDEGLEHSWAAFIGNKEYDLLTACDVQRWVVSCYFALTTMVTIGYGDITPVTIRETVMVLFFEVVGVAFFGYLINQVAAVLAAAGPRAKRHQMIKEKLQDVEESMQGLGLPLWLKRKIRAYYAFRWMPVANHEARYQFYSELPPKLRARLLQQRQQAALDHLNFFPPNLGPGQRRVVAQLLAAASTPVMLLPGQQLRDAEEQAYSDDSGGCGPYCYILEEGEMQTLHRGGRMHTGKHSASSIVNFSGPALVGLAALFSPAAMGLSMITGRPTNRHAGRSRASDVRGDGDSSSSSSSSGSSSHDGTGGDSHSSVANLIADGSAWRQHALARTDCHLWRIDCRQLYGALRQKQPQGLLHLLDKLLERLEAECTSAGGSLAAEELLPAKSDGAGNVPPVPATNDEQQQQQPSWQQGQQGQPACQQQPSWQPRQSSLCRAMVERLRTLQADLEAAVTQQQGSTKHGSAAGHGSGVSMATRDTSNTFSLETSWQTDVELSSVAVARERTRWAGTGQAADVWHNG